MYGFITPAALTMSGIIMWNKTLSRADSPLHIFPSFYTFVFLSYSFSSILFCCSLFKTIIVSSFSLRSVRLLGLQGQEVYQSFFYLRPGKLKGFQQGKLPKLIYETTINLILKPDRLPKNKTTG